MTLRKITSLTALLSFIAMLVTSLVLYVVPQGRVAYWADWHLLGLDKTQWGDLHINMGLLFLLAIGLHIYYNWKPILAYLKDKARRLRIFTPDFSVAFAVTVVILAGTLLSVPPFDWPRAFNAHLKNAAAAKYGEPPYGHAELSTLDQFARKTGLDFTAAMAALQEAGIPVDGPLQTLQTMARRSGRSPQELFGLMQTARSTDLPPGLPRDAPPGTGRKTLKAVCQTHGLPLNEITSMLRQSGLEVDPQLTLKDIGAKNGMGATAVYDALRQAATAGGLIHP